MHARLQPVPRRQRGADEADRAHAGDVRQLALQTLVHLRQALRLAVVGTAQRHGKPCDPVALEAGIDVGEPFVRAHQQSAGHQQHQRQRGLRRDERGAPALLGAAAKVAATAVAQHVRRLHAPAQQHRHRAGEQAGDGKRADGNGKRRRVRLEAQVTRQRQPVEWRHRQEPVEQPRSQQRAQGAACDHQHQRLGEELQRNAPGAGAQRGADGELAPAVENAREQQAADVDGGDHQQQRRRREQHGTAAAQPLAPALAERLHTHLPAAVDVGMRGRERLVDALGLGLRRADRCSRAQPPDRPGRPGVAVGAQRAGFVLLERDEELDDVVFHRPLEAALRHADDRVGGVRRAKRPADNSGIATEVAQPRVVAQHHHRRRIGRVIGRLQHPAQCRADAEGLEIATRHALAAQALGAAVEEHRGAHPRGAEECIERRHRAEVGDLRDRQRDAGVDLRFVEPDAHQALGCWKRHRPDQRCAHQRRNGGGGGGAKRDAKDGSKGEPRRVPQAANGMGDRRNHCSRQGLPPPLLKRSLCRPADGERNRYGAVRCGRIRCVERGLGCPIADGRLRQRTRPAGREATRRASSSLPAAGRSS